MGIATKSTLLGLACLAAAGVAVSAAAQQGTCTMDPKTAPAKHRKVETKNYTIEVPAGWEVGEETPFGQREIVPAKGPEGAVVGSMSSMTGPGLGKQSWDQLYNTSLYFITRYAPGKGKMTATPYKLGKSKQGFETCSWTMLDEQKRPIQQHVILKHTNGNILALSVKLPPSAAKQPRTALEAEFRRLVDTAVVR